jgi:hypothetical protein
VATPERLREPSLLVVGPLEAVEDEVEAELVLLPVVVARLQDVLDGEGGEPGVVLARELLQEGLRQLGGLLGGAEGQVPLLQGEPVDVAVEG